MALADPTQIIFLAPAFTIIVLVAVICYAYRHGKRVGRLEAQAAAKTQQTRISPLEANSLLHNPQG